MDSKIKKHEVIVKESWQRCREFGLQHDAEPDWQNLAKADTRILQESHHSLINTTDHAVLPYYENILSNSPCLILLADSRGHVLNSWGEKRFLSMQQSDWFSAGANWQEVTTGTNAIGTALASREAVQIQRDEHFLKRHRYMIGSAAPIFDANNDLLGVLDISSDTYMPQAHTLGMVRLMSQSIENKLIVDKYHKHNYIATINTHFDNLDSQWSGIVVFNSEGLIVTCNRRAEQLLRYDLRRSNVEYVLNMNLIDLSHQAKNTPFKLQVLGKYQMYAQISAPSDSGLIKTIPVLNNELPTQHTKEADTVNLNVTSNADTVITLDTMAFGDKRMQRAVLQAQKVIEKDIPILIHGETGVGKEVFVNALHCQSQRSVHPLIALNCAAIPADLVESELFGYSKGAFTGADSKGSIGLIRKADKGILFLDEIGDMPLNVQARLLRVLQERKVMPLGSTHSYPVDIKLISATNCDLKKLVDQGVFRKDLFYRVSGLNIELPALRDRTDKEALFKAIFATKCQQPSKAQIDPAILNMFLAHPWPGNIRQFISVLDVALAMSDDEIIEQWHLPDDFFADLDMNETLEDMRNQQEYSPDPRENEDEIDLTDDHSLEQNALESQQTLSRYRQFSGNISKAAKALGISRNTMYKRLRALGIK